MNIKEPIAIFASDYNDVNKEVFSISVKDTLFIHSPINASNIRRVVFNGVEMPVVNDGVRAIRFEACAGELCHLEIDRVPVRAKRVEK